MAKANYKNLAAAYDLDDTRTLRSVGEMFNVSHQTVKRACELYNIPIREEGARKEEYTFHAPHLFTEVEKMKWSGFLMAFRRYVRTRIVKEET